MGLTHQLTRNLFTITGLGHVFQSSNNAGLGQAVDHVVGWLKRLGQITVWQINLPRTQKELYFNLLRATHSDVLIINLT